MGARREGAVGPRRAGRGAGGPDAGRWTSGLRALAGSAALLVLVVAAGGPARAGGDWRWPLAGTSTGSTPEVTRAFAPPAVRYGAGHRGVDLRGAPGAAVVAAGAGRVAFAGVLAGRGVVVVEHGALRTTYEPVTASVAVGAQVAAGTPLGRLDAGHAGCPARACLHWGLRRGEQYLDPLSLVGAGPVRLLPLGEAAHPAAGGTATARDGAPAPEPLPAPEEPAWGLRSAATPSGLLAVLALLGGLWLLRPRRPLSDPGGAAAGRVAPVRQREPDPPPPGPTPVPADVVDLAAERGRRRELG